MNGRTALHLALIASLTACAYPLTALLCVWDGKPAGLSAWGMAGLLALLLWLGLGGILLVRRTYYRHPRWVNSALWTLSALAGVGAAFLAPLDTVFFRILLGAAAAGAFFGGTRLLFLPPETLAHPYVFAGVCTWEVAAGLLLRLHCPDASGLPYVLLLAGQSAVFAVAHNQEALRRVLHGRDGEEWELPREVQRRNRLLMGALFGIGGLLLLCSKPAAHGVRWLLTKILTVLWAALRWFLNCFSGNGTSEESSEVAEEAGELAQQSAPWWSTWLSTFFWILCWAAIVAVLVWKRREVCQAVRRFWYHLRSWFLAHWNAHPVEESDDGAYCDYVENLQVGEAAFSRPAPGNSRRQWRHAYRRYSRMAPDVEKYRLGYGLLLAKLPAETAKPSDSPAEVLAHLQAFPEQAALLSRWTCVTDAYSALRYGGIPPAQEAFAAMEQLLEQFL